MKLRKWLLIAMLSLASTATFALAACGEPETEDPSDNPIETPDPGTPEPEKPVVEGPETGVYYFDADGDEYLVTLSGGDRFTLHIQGKDFSGTYAVTNGAVAFKFLQEGEAATATIADDVLTLAYKGGEYRFLKKITYTVSFEEAGGTEVADASVVNGQTLLRPADPQRDGYKFIGWTTSEGEEDFYAFGDAIVTGDLTLYAYWAPYTPGQSEYTVSFDLGDAGGTLADLETIGGRLYGVTDPTREGYAFDGWWVSMYDDAEKLSYRWEQDMVFTEDTTLYAVWTQEGAAGVNVYVNGDGVSWDTLSKSGRLVITGPDGFQEVNRTIGVTASTTYDIDFASQPAGDYVITLTSGEASSTVYYRNKALDRVDGFTVVDPSMLVFEGVEHAERYYITVECGNPAHNHTMLDIATATTYDFSGCTMPEDGIKFTVTAVAEGYATSTSRTFVYNRVLGAVTGLTVREDTQTLVWNSVPGASNYVVTVNGIATDVGGSTSFSLKDYEPGELLISVRAETKGYNSADPATLTYLKTVLAAPKDVRIADELVTWEAVDGATSYELRVGSQTFANLTETQFDLSTAKDLTFEKEKDYEISVRAVGATTSLWSDPVDARYYALYQTLTYERNTLSWRPVIGAVSYTVQVNGGAEQTIEAGETSAKITLTRDGINTVSVCFSDGEVNSDWVTLEVRAYTVTFDTRGGAAVSPVYVAVGDEFALPETTKLGQEFEAWYLTPGGASSNGAAYADEVFRGGGDLTLYAYWSNKVYNVNLNYGQYGTGAATAQVKYNEEYQLPVPVTNGLMVFIGWYNSPDVNGVRYTDEAGMSAMGAWTRTDEGATLYAVYVDALEVVVNGSGYSIRAGAGISRVENLVIPSVVNGRKVIAIDDYAFEGCDSLRSITIPDTIRSIASTAFDGCDELENYYVASTGEPDPLFSAIEGTIVYRNTMTQELEIAFVPATRTGIYTIPESVTRINTNTFNGSELTEIIIPASVTSVAPNAFVGLDDLTRITFLEGGTNPLTFDAAAISDCSKLATITFPARLMAFEEEESTVFASLEKLTAIEIVGSYANAAYSSYDGMLLNANGDTLLYCPLGKTGEMVIPNAIINIGEYAFGSKETGAYARISKITFHSGMRNIGEGAFYGDSALETAIFQASAVPSGLYIGDYAFYKCSNLEVVTFEETGALNGTQYKYTTSCGVKEIGAFAFSGTSVAELLLPSTLTALGEEAFSSVGELESIDFSHVNSNLEFGQYAFKSCTSLTSVSFPDNVGVIDFNSVFRGCSKLGELTVSETNPNYTTGEDGVLYDKAITRIIFFPEGFEGTYTVPSTVTVIGGGAFYGKTNLTSIVIPATVTEIGASAFEGCSKLESITITDGTEDLTIGDYAFYRCTSLETVTLPSRTVSIGDYAFSFGSTSEASLTSITLNEGLESIGDYAFYRAGTLSAVNIPSTVSYLGRYAFGFAGIGESTLNIPEGADFKVTFAATPEGQAPVDLTMGDYAFYMTAARTVQLPERLVNIAQYAFWGSPNLTSVTVPTTVRNVGDVRAIGTRAFYDCENLESVTFTLGGTQPLSIAAEAFWECPKLTSLTLPARASGMKNMYDVFEMVDATTLDNPHYLGMAFTDYDGDVSVKSGTKEITLPAFAQINVAEENIPNFTPQFWSYDGILYSGDKKTVVYCPTGRTGEVEISKYAETIRPGAFYDCAGITAITFEDAENVNGVDFYLDDVDDSTLIKDVELYFYGCASLKSIAFPARLTRLGANSLRLYANYPNLRKADYGLETITFAEGCRLTEIGDYAFAGGTSYDGAKIESIVLPDGVDVIGQKAFDGCLELGTITVSKLTDAEDLANLIDGVDNLEAIVVPEGSVGLKVDEGLIFSADMTQLLYRTPEFAAESYTVPAEVTNIPAYAFQGLTFLKKIAFEPGTENLTIGNYAFDGTGLTEVEIPARLYSMGTYAFANCESLTKVTFEEGYSLGAIPNYAFRNSAIESINIPAAVTQIGQYAFAGTALRTITFGDANNLSQLYAISSNAFNGAKQLTSIEIPATVRYLGGTISNGAVSGTVSTSMNTFRECTSLRTVTFLGNSVEFIGGSVFYKCTSLRSINLEALTNLTGIGTDAFRYCESLLSVTIPESVTTLGNAIFADCTSLRSADIRSAAPIGVSEFDGCTDLATVTFNPAITAIGSSAFLDCTSLDNVVLPAELEMLGFSRSSLSSNISAPSYITSTKVFQNCTSLTSIAIPAKVTELFGYTFAGCTSLAEVDLGSVQAIYGNVFEDCTSLKSIDLPDTLLNLGVGKEIDQSTSSVTSSTDKYAFAGSGLTSISIPSSVIAIGASAFSGCEDLAVVIFEGGATGASSLRAINNKAFKDCTSLTTIVLPANIETVAGYVFQNCTKLKEITLPVSVESAGTYLFDGCTSLDTVKWESSVNIGDYTFRGCKALDIVTINDSVQKIGKFAFENCTSLVSVKLPASLTMLGSTSSSTLSLTTDVSVFSGCTALKEVTLPAGITQIAKNTFENCTSLLYLHLNAPVTFGPGSLTGCTALSSTLQTAIPTDGYALYVDDGFVYIDAYVGGQRTADRILAAYLGSDTAITAKMFDTAVTEIGAFAFYGNTKITEMTIPATIVSVGQGAFAQMTALKTVTFLESTDASRKLVLEDATSSSNGIFYGDKVLEKVVLPKGLTYIGAHAFRMSSSSNKLASVNIPEGVTEIGTYAFYYAKLTALELPSTLKTIGTYAFGNCSSLVTLEIADGLEEIGENAFRSATRLTSITLPSTLKTIGKYAFYGATALEEIHYNAKALGDLAASNNVFYNGGKNSDGITLYVGEAVESVPAWLFHPYSATSNNYVPKITSIVFLGNSLKSVGASAFKGVTAIESIYYKGSLIDLAELVPGIATDNDPILDTSIIYIYSETAPATTTDEDGNTVYEKPSLMGITGAGYWHFNAEGEAEVWVYVEPEEPEEPDPEQPGTGTEEPDPEQPGTGTEEPDPEQPGTGTEEPDPEQPGTGTEEPDPNEQTPAADAE